MLVKACNVANAAAGKVAKFLSQNEGPYDVKNRIARNTQVLSNTKTDRERGVFHTANLKPYRTERQAGLGLTREEGESSKNDSSGKTSGEK